MVQSIVRGMLAVALLTASLPFAKACPFCSVQGQTLSGEVNQADFIVAGELKNPKRDATDITKGSTELHITDTVKSHPYLAGKKILMLPRYVDIAAGETRYLVFCSVYANNIDATAAAVTSTAILGNLSRYTLDPYRGEPVKADSKLPEYLKGALAVREKDSISKLNYFFRHLDSADTVIAADAFMEFGNTDYKDIRTVAEKLPPDTLIAWLKNPQTPASRYGVYGMMLGHCGKKEHAQEIRALLDDANKVYSSGLDGLLAGYIMLDPKGGWQYLTGMLNDDKKEFPLRYAGLKVLRFFWESRSDVISHEEVLSGMKMLVSQSDIADLPIEDLRKWEQWDTADFVIATGKRESHQSIPIVRRSILRFAITASPKSKIATEYVADARRIDGDRVKLVEEMLSDEKPKPAATVKPMALLPKK